MYAAAAVAPAAMAAPVAVDVQILQFLFGRLLNVPSAIDARKNAKDGNNASNQCLQRL